MAFNCFCQPKTVFVFLKFTNIFHVCFAKAATTKTVLSQSFSHILFIIMTVFAFIFYAFVQNIIQIFNTYGVKLFFEISCLIKFFFYAQIEKCYFDIFN